MVLLPEAIYYLLNQISDGSKRICPGPFETYHMLFWEKLNTHIQTSEIIDTNCYTDKIEMF